MARAANIHYSGRKPQRREHPCSLRAERSLQILKLGRECPSGTVSRSIEIRRCLDPMKATQVFDLVNPSLDRHRAEVFRGCRLRQAGARRGKSSSDGACLVEVCKTSHVIDIARARSHPYTHVFNQDPSRNKSLEERVEVGGSWQGTMCIR